MTKYPTLEEFNRSLHCGHVSVDQIITDLWVAKGILTQIKELLAPYKFSSTDGGLLAAKIKAVLEGETVDKTM